MLCALECNERSVKTIRLPGSIAIAPATSMARKTVHKFMVAKILRVLIAIGLARVADSRSVKKRETQSIVAGPVRASLGAGKNCDAETAALIGEVEPAMRRHLEHFFVVRRALDGSSAPIVSRGLIRSGEGESGFQGGFASVPVNRICEFDAIAGIPGGEANRLHEFRAFGFAFDSESDADRTVFDNADFCGTADVAARRLALIRPVHVPRGPLRRLFRLESEARGR